MPHALNEYAAPPPTYSEVIEKAIKDWTDQLENPITLPINEQIVGSLALLITKRLVKAGLIDPE